MVGWSAFVPSFGNVQSLPLLLPALWRFRRSGRSRRSESGWLALEQWWRWRRGGMTESCGRNGTGIPQFAEDEVTQREFQ